MSEVISIESLLHTVSAAKGHYQFAELGLGEGTFMVVAQGFETAQDGEHEMDGDFQSSGGVDMRIEPIAK